MNELQIGEYFIPEGCTLKRIGNTIQVYRKKVKKLKEGDYRCKDCKHYICGHTCLSHWTTMVCELRPKELSQALERRKALNKRFKDYKLYRAAQAYNMPCELFEVKTNN